MTKVIMKMTETLQHIYRQARRLTRTYVSYLEMTKRLAKVLHVWGCLNTATDTAKAAGVTTRNRDVADEDATRLGQRREVARRSEKIALS